ncbi:unnamed protein product [Prorocentrum cordatum]|uniref:Uncharacterized protein n=1 Tax=Prorocentrum cordatum TaxID=2364126 RepID=A0ABN9S0U3_9DINO|nr:unnamed protein product [Polarella glacialis]
MESPPQSAPESGDPELTGADVAPGMSWLDGIAWIYAALTAVAFATLAMLTRASKLSWGDVFGSLSTSNVSLLLLTGAIATACRAAEENACPRVAASTEFNEMLSSMKQEAKQRILGELAIFQNQG